MYGRFVGAHLTELVEPVQAQALAHELNEVAENIVRCHAAIEAQAQTISMLASTVGATRSEDVSSAGLHSQSFFTAAQTTLQDGGAHAIVLRRDPRHPEHEAVA